MLQKYQRRRRSAPQKIPLFPNSSQKVPFGDLGDKIFEIMKKSFNLFIIVLLISFLGGCKKDKSTRIEGRVLEKGSKKPVAGAKIIFSECVAGEGTFSPSVCLDLESTLTDADGKYVFVKASDTAERYRIRAEKDNYGKPVEVYQVATAGEKTKNMDFTLPAFAWVKFHVKNVNPVDESDYVITPWSYKFYGKNIDTIYTTDGFLGNFKNNIYWTITRQFKTVQFMDSIYCKPLDTLFYEIKY